MSADEFLALARALERRHRVEGGKGFRLRDHAADDAGPLRSMDKATAKANLEDAIGVLTRRQDMMYAQDRWSLLLIFQAMDAAGKDGAIKHVMSGVNPQGCSVHSFKAPSHEELDHDFLWRCATRLPARGMIGIFNRSYYEEVLVVRVHPQLLAGQPLPDELRHKDIWDERFRDIRNFEQHLHDNGTIVRKIFLHVSRDEQRRRFLERIDEPEKHWKFSERDVAERAHWDRYMECYEDAIKNTASKECPWYVIPADRKWYTRLAVSAVVTEVLASIDVHYPKPTKERAAALAKARASLEAEG